MILVPLFLALRMCYGLSWRRTAGYLLFSVYLAAVDSVEALRQRHIRRYTVTLDSVQQAAAFAKDFDGQQEGCRVTVATRQSLEEIFMNYYGGRGE